MKRVFAVILILLLICGTGCSPEDQNVRFYYLRSEYVPGAGDGIIAPENRDVTGDRALNYILRLYLKGPVSEQYLSPFPEGLYPVSVQQEAEVLSVVLSPEFSVLQDIDLTLAAGCIASTCFDLTDATQIHIRWGTEDSSTTIVMDRDSLILTDHIISTEAAE